MSELNTTKCPHCGRRINKNSEEFEKAERNAEYYGDNTFVFVCKKCKKKMRVVFKRTIKISVDYISKTPGNDICDFGIKGI